MHYFLLDIFFAQCFVVKEMCVYVFIDKQTKHIHTRIKNITGTVEGSKFFLGGIDSVSCWIKEVFNNIWKRSL